MKYIEELTPGDTFTLNSSIYIVTIDFRKNGSKLCIDLQTGSPRWIDASEIVDFNPIYILDASNNIIPIKNTPKQHE